MEIKQLDVGFFFYLMISFDSCMQYFISATVLEDTNPIIQLKCFHSDSMMSNNY